MLNFLSHGVFPRRKAGLSVLFLIGGLFACFNTLVLGVLGVPFTFLKAREAAALPRPTADALQTLSPGTSALVTARLPLDMEAGPYGLGLYSVELSRSAAGEDSVSDDTETGLWKLETPPPQWVTLLLDNGYDLRVQMPETVSFLNANTFEEADTRRYKGFLPGQTLTIEGTWEGDDLMTARALYAGSSDAYVSYLREQPGMSFVGSAFCGGVGIVLLCVALVLRFAGR